MNPQYPIFVPTKGRYKAPLTIKELERIKVPYTVVVEEQEVEEYRKVVHEGEILVLPHRDKGLIVTRNWIWDYAQHTLKVPYFWTIDDNVRHFYELNQNMKWYVTSGTFLHVMEDFCQRYENVIIGGMQYEMFTPRKQKHPPFIPNTRIYSNMFIKADAPYRNQLFYNDDTDLCLRVLKDGNCTVLFNIYVAEKIQTMRIKGGMTDYYEQTNKRKEFADMLQHAHPDVVKVVWKYHRWHHEVDYRPFRNNAFKLKEGVVIPQGPNDYGMKKIITTPLNLKPAKK